MSKKCPFCQSEMPDEARFCLNCCKSLSSASAAEPVQTKKRREKLSGSLIKDRFYRYKLTFSKVIHNPKNKKAFPIAAVSVLTVCICLLVAAAIPKHNDPETITQTVLVTDENGVAVTNENGENVYEVIEVTTEHQGFFDSLFGNDDDKSDSEESTGGSFFDKIFGSDEKTSSDASQNSSSGSSETVGSTDSGNAGASATDAPTQAVQTTEKSGEAQVSDSSEFSYAENGDGIKITGYNGSAANIIVPAYIDGKRVTGLGENAFSSNSSVKTITFEDANTGDHNFYIPFQTCVFNNLPNLTKITLPVETCSNVLYNGNPISISSGGYFSYLISSCPKLEGVYFGKNLTGNSSLTQIDGVVVADSYYESGKTILYYPQGKKTSNYVTPAGVTRINQGAIKNNPYLETLTLSSEIVSVYAGYNFIGCKKLSSFVAASGNSHLSSQNGVLYVEGATINGVGYTGVCYPPAKTDTDFTFRNDINIALTDKCFTGNPYIQTVRLPKKSYIYSYGISKSGEYKPSSLKTFYVTSDSANNGSSSVGYEIKYTD